MAVCVYASFSESVRLLGDELMGRQTFRMEHWLANMFGGCIAYLQPTDSFSNACPSCHGPDPANDTLLMTFDIRIFAKCHLTKQNKHRITQSSLQFSFVLFPLVWSIDGRNQCDFFPIKICRCSQEMKSGFVACQLDFDKPPDRMQHLTQKRYRQTISLEFVTTEKNKKIEMKQQKVFCFIQIKPSG